MAACLAAVLALLIVVCKKKKKKKNQVSSHISEELANTEISSTMSQITPEVAASLSSETDKFGLEGLGLMGSRTRSLEVLIPPGLFIFHL